MSVPDQPTIFIYTGNGITTTFAYGFYLLSAEDIVVAVNGVVQTSGFSVNGIGSQSGGAVVFDAAPADDTTIQIYRQVAVERDTDYQRNGDLRSDDLNRDFDRLWMALQDNRRDKLSSIRYPIAENLDGELPISGSRALMLLGFDSLGNHTMVPFPMSIGAGDMRVDTFTAGVDFTPDVTTQLTLSRAPGNPANLEIFFDPLYQGPDQWSLTGTQVTFSAPIPGGVQKVFARIGTTLSLNVPAQGSVGEDEIAWSGLLSRVVNSLAALKALDTLRYTNAHMTGLLTSGDGADGEWRFDPASIATPNDITIVQPNTGTGRWLRIFDGVTIKACWAGAGMGAADDTSAITAAIAATPTGGTLDFEGRQYNLIPSTNVAYKDKFNVTRKTAVQITSRSKLALLFREGSKVVVNGTDAERVAFFLKSCSNITIAAPNFPNVSGNTSIAGSDYIVSENYFPFAFEGNDGVFIYRPNFEACRSALMADAFNGLQNKNIVVDGLRTYQVCNYSIITRNADNIQVRNARMEQTGRTWNTSNEDVAFSDNSTNCKAVNCDALQPHGRVSRFTSVNNVGPTVFENCRLTGEGIWIEINQGSNIEVVGGFSKRGTGERISEHILFTSDVFTGNANVTVTGAQFFGGGSIVTDYYPVGWGGADIEGFVMTGCTAQDTYGVQMSLDRVGVVFKGNRFNLNDGGILIRPGGVGTVFEGNSVKNGYVRVDGDNFKATGNDMTGKVGSPISFAWDVQGCVGFVERDNTYTASSYTQFYNHAPGARFGARYLEVGINSNPQFSLAAFITGVLGDFFKNDAPVDGSPEGWVCTASGSPGTWRERGQNGFRSTLGAPSVNAIYVGEELLDSTNSKWYKAKNTGTGATDWVALN